MKLHLPTSLRKALLAVLASTTFFSAADAACLHAAVSPTTYTDFGQNMARYSVYQVNDLLTQIRDRDGVQIPYTTGTPPATMGVGQPMISFEGVNGDGAFTAVGYNYTATVAHNGCPNPCFTARYLGNNDGIQYQGVEYRSSQDKVFLLSPSIDYKITRSSKIYTDITASGVFDTTAYLRSGKQVTDLVHYRAGAGTCDQADFQGNTHNLAGGYAYITGGVVATLGFSYAGSYDYTQEYEPGQGPRDSRGVIDDPYTISIRGIQDYGPGGAGQPTPDNPKVYLLPFVSRGGDSGSPVWAWNDVTKAYELISCHQARGGDNSYSRGASEWTMGAMEYFNKHVDMDAAGNTVTLHEVRTTSESKTIYDDTNKVGTTTQFGSITGANEAFDAVSFCGVGGKENNPTIYTWLSLYDQKDVQNWYHYGNTYFNANGNGNGKDMHLGDLFYTENIVFESASTSENRIVLDADIDMGIGYAQFSRAEGAPDGQNVVFRLESQRNVEENRDFFLSSAGYIVDKGVELHIGITNTQWDAAHNDYYYREWRKQGDGDMYIEGTSNNEVFLNLGGKGTTYLNETDGYAAYNVLINNGATLDFGGDIKQIARDVTFGNGGGYLEFSGLSSFDWKSGVNDNVEADGFTINALTQDAILINSKDSTTLRYLNTGNTTFLGSFQDTKNSSLTVINEGGGTWTLQSIHTNLQNANSRFIAANGTTELVGQLTVHGIGSVGGKGGTRYSHPDDWHYSDATMNVEVRNGATFRLGSHARLTGDVDVRSGGTLEIAEGVRHQYEYIEGWLIAEDTCDEFYRGFYGLKGDVRLDDGATLRFKFSSGTDAENVYGGDISGAGNVDMQLGGSGATLVLSGTNDFTGTKTLAGGGLIAEAYTALGDTQTEKWHVNETAFIAVKGIDGNTALTHIAGDSTGVIALTRNQANQVDLRQHERMFVGALAGEKVEYGESPQTVGSRTVYTEETLDTVTLDGNKYWQLGGGGGELVVNFLLDDPESQLVLGNEYTTGTVTLTNVWNRIGSIFFAGKVTLNYTSEEALGGSKISLDYTNRVAGSASVVNLLTRHSSGAMMLDGMENTNVDLADHKELFLGAEGYVDYRGTITPDGGAYRFGGITGTLVLHNALTEEADSHLDLIVDAQTYSGGTLALAASAGITGDVTVMGHDATRPGFTGGDIALRTDVNNAIESAYSVTLKDGGILDINGTDQTLHRFNMEAGSLLTDTSANWNGKVTLEVAQGDTSTLAGAVDVNYMVKEGEGTLLLAGDNAYGNLVINNGLVQLQNGNSLSASGVTIVEDNGVLDFSGGFDVTGTVAFSGGTAKVGGKAINGSLMVGTTGEGEAETGTLLQGTAGISTRINASVEVAEGSTLTMKGSNGTFVLSNTEINEAGGTIELQGKQLTIDRGGSDPVNIGGTISLVGHDLPAGSRVTLYSKGGSDNMTRNINELRINNSATISEESWNTIWNIHALTGEGDLLWDSHTTHWYSARLVLDGASTFTGQLTAQRTGGRENNREYQAYVELAHDEAAQNIDMTINGQTANFMSLAINTENAEVKTLSGNSFAVLYAGAAQPGTDHDAGTTLHEQPLSTRQAFLTLTGDGDHDFQGNVVGQDVYEQMKTKEDGTQEKIGEVHNTGLSLVMKGSGTQTFSGEQTRFNSVDVNSGHLVLSSANLTIKEDVSLAAGASLAATHGLTLTGGQTLNIYSEGAVSADNKATFTGNLTLQEGSFVNVGAFTELNGNLVMNDAYMVITGLAMDSTTPTIGITGSVSGSVEFSLTNTAALSTGTAYYLASRDWTNTEVTLDLSESPYLTASVNKTNHGLYVTFQTTADSFVWNGNQGSHTWDASHFGQQETVPGASHTAVFTNSAENPDVVISASASVGSIVIDSTRDYLFHSENGSVITTDKLVKSGSGKAEVSAAVVVGTSDKMGTVEINDGELVVKSANTLAHIQSITGAGTLGISYQNAQESVFFHTNDDYVGTLHIENGSYTSDVGLHYNDLLLGNSSTYTLGTNKSIFGAVTVDGNAAEINLQNNTLTAGDIILKSDLTLRGRNLNKATGKLSATVDGVGHTVFTEGEVVISSPNFNANLNVSDNTHLAGGVYSEIGTITLNSSAVLTIDSGTAITNLADIFMGAGSRINLENGNGGNTALVANITMTGRTAEIDGTYNGNGTSVQGFITGQGTLTLGRYSNHTNSWRVDSIISDAQEGRSLALVINSNVTLTAENTYTGGTTISGSTVQVSNEQAFAGGSLNMTGGTLKLNSNLNLSTLSGVANSTLQLNGKKLILTGNGGSFAGTVSGTGSIAMDGSGTQEFSKAAFFADIAVNSGTLQLGGGSATGKVTVARDARLSIADNDFTISSAVENAGTFAFTGASHKLVLDPSGSFEQVSLGYKDITGGTASGNGFAQGTTIKVINNQDGASIENVNTVSYLGDTLQLNAQTGYATMGASTSVYSVRTGEVAYNDDFTSHGAASGISVFSLASESSDAPATFTLEKGLANGVTILSAGLGGNVEIVQGVELAQTQLNAQARTTLIGSGTYALNQGSWKLPSNVVLGDKDKWTGIVRVSKFADNGVNFANLANANSWVEVNGMTAGYLAPWDGGTLSTNLILTDHPDVGFAMYMNNGSGREVHPVMTVSGKWKGDGTLRNGNTGQTLNLDLKFTGDISGWTGKYEQMGSSSVLSFANRGGMEVNASFAKSGKGVYSLEVINDTTFNGTIADAQLFTVKDGAKATLAGADKVMDDIAIEENAILSNTGYTYLGGTVSNSGEISNSGTLEYGYSLAGVNNVTNLNDGNIIVNTLLTQGHIDNSGTITLSSLMQGEDGVYVDANDKSGEANPNNNGFATSSFQVLSQKDLITNRDGGKIMYCGEDVTSQVMNDGWVRTAANYGTYNINSSDDSITFSKIYAKSGGALEYIMFAGDSTSLKVDNYSSGGQTAYLHTSQVFDVGEATLEMQDGATLVVDASTTATVTAVAGGTLNLMLDGTTPETHMQMTGLTPNGATVNVSGSGVLDIGNGQYDIATLNINSGTVYSNHSGGTGFSGHNAINIKGGGALQLANQDNLGWQGGATTAINLQGTDSETLAVLELGNRQTFSTALSLQGHSEVRQLRGASGTGMLDPYKGGSVSVSGTDNLLAVPIRMRENMTISVLPQGELIFDGGVTDQANHKSKLTKAGAGKMILAGSGHQYTESEFDISAGSLDIQTNATFKTLTSSGSLGIVSGSTGITTYTGNSGSSLSVEQGASLIFNGTTKLSAPITNNGNLSFASGSSVTLNGTFDHGNGAYLDLDTGLSSEDGNGLQSGAYVVVSTGSGSYTVDGPVAVTYAGQQYTLQEDGKAYQAIDDSIYYVRSGTANYSQAVASTNSITQLNLIPNATLNLQTNLSSAVVQEDGIQASGGMVIIGEGVVLSRDSLHASAATTVNGTGTYSMDVAGGTSRGANVNFGADWNGTIRLYGEANQVLNLNDVSRQDSAYAPIELAGVTASLTEGTIHPALKLTDAVGGALALTVKNAGSFTFDGTISGSGTMANDSEGNTTFSFSGANLADWTGAIQNNSGNLTVAISGMESGGTMGAALVGVNTVSYTGNAGSDTYSVASLQSNDGGTTLTCTAGTLEVESLTGSGDLTVNGSVKLSGGEYAGDRITVNRNATLHINGVQAENTVLGGEGTISLEAPQVTVAGVNASGSITGAAGSSHTLEIAGKGGESSAAIGSGVDLVMSGSGTQAFNGDVSEFDGAVDVLDGTLTFGQAVNISALTMQGGEIGLADGSSLGSVRIASGAEASINAQGGTIALKHAIMNSGVLTLAGTIDASALTMQTRDKGYIAVGAETPTENGSGFATVQSAVEVVRNVVAGELRGSNIIVTYGDNLQTTLDEDGWARFNTGTDTHYDTYYLRDNKVADLAVSDIQAAVQGDAELNKIVFDNMETPVNLIVDTTTDLSLFRVNEDCTANLNLSESGSINLPDGYRGVEGFVKLGGEGTYSIANTTSLGRGVSLSAQNWHGNVVLRGTADYLDLAQSSGLWTGADAASSSTVILDGWTGALTDTGWETNAHIVLGEHGMTVQGSALEGETAPTYAFNGKVSGTGNITNARDGSSEFSFADVQDWEGSFVARAGESFLSFTGESVAASIEADGGVVTAQFGGAGQTSVSGNLSTGGTGRLDVIVLNDTTFTGDADVSLLHVEDASAVHIASTFTTQDIDSAGNIVVEQAGVLNVENSIPMLASTITNSGTVAFSTPDTVIKLMDGGEYMESESTYKDIDGGISATGNGFKLGGGVTIIDNRGGSITGAQNVTVNYGGIAYQLQDSGVLLNPADVHTYYIHQGAVNYSSVKDAEGLVGLHLDSTLKPDAGATLNLDTNLAETLTDGIVSSGGTINLGQDVTLAASSLKAQGDTKLSGQGTYDLGSGVTSFGEHVSLAGDWNGIVRISDAHMSPFTFSNYANNHSSVEVLGISGWWNTSVRDFNGKLILGKDDEHPEKVALKLTDASSNYTYTLNGGVSGEGDYMLAYDSAKRISATTHTIKGDVSDWTGSFVDAVAQTNTAHTATLRFENNTAENGMVTIEANILDQRSGREDHVFNVNVTGTNGSVHMKGNVQGIDKLTYDSAANGRTLTIDHLETNDNGTTILIGQSYGAGVVINDLRGTGELILDNATKNSNLVSFDLAGGDYSCDAIEFRAMTTALHTGPRSVLLSISDSDVAANSVIHTTVDVQSSCGNNACIGIGINAETVSVGGLNDVGGATANASNLRYSIVSGKPTGSVTNGFSSDSVFRTLEITGEGGDSIAGIGSHLNLVMNSAEGEQSFSGDMSSFNGSIDVEQGSLALASNNIHLGSVDVKQGGSLVIGAGENANVTAGGTITNAGYLMMNGRIHLDVAQRGNFEEIAGSGETRFDGEGQYEGSGYLVSTSKYYLVKGAAGSELDTEQLNESFVGGTWVKDAGEQGRDIVFTFNTGDRTGTYFVNSNYVYDAAEMGNATAFAIKEGVTLTAANADPYATPKTLNGGGTYRLASGATVVNQGLSFGPDWLGVVSMNGVTGNGGISSPINALGTASGSWVELNGVSGYLGNGSNNNEGVTADIILTGTENGGKGDALIINNGYNTASHAFTGTIQGHGNLHQNWNSTSSQTYRFQGDISGWDGSFKTSGGAGAITVYYEQNATQINTPIVHNRNASLDVHIDNDKDVTVNGTIERQQGSLNLFVNANATFNGALTDVSTLTVGSGKTATLKGESSISTLSGAGSLTVDSGDNSVLLNAVSEYTGDVNVTSGTLDLTNAASTVTLGSLTMNSGGTLKLDAENMLAVTESLTLGANATLDLSQLALSGERSSYMLASGGNISVDKNVILTLAPEYQDKASLYASGGTLVLLLDTGHKSLVWQGPEGEWSINPTARNWYEDNTEIESAFADGDTVRFGSASNGHTATLGSNVNPAGITVNESASTTVNLGGHALTTDLVTVASGSTLTVSGTEGSFTNNGSLSLNNSKLSINNAGAEVMLGNVSMENGATLEVLAADSAEARSVFAGDNANATIKLGVDMTISKGDSDAATAGALYTIGANHTLQITSADGAVHTLTADKFDIANVGTKVNLQNTDLVVKGAATVGELSTRSNNHGTMTVGPGASLTFDGSVVWSNGGKYVDLDVSGTVNVNGGTANTLHDVTVNAGGDINFAAETATTIEGALSLATTIDNSGSLTLSGTVTLTGSLTEDYDFAEKVTGYSGQGEYAGSGYEVDATNYYLVKNTGTGTLSSTATSSDASVILSVKDNSLLFHTAGQQGTVYYINKDLTYDASEMGEATAIHVSENQTLTGTMAEVTAKPFAGTGKVVVSNDIGDGTLTFNGVTEGFDGTLSLTRAAGNHNKKLVLNNFNGTLEYAGRFELNGSNLGEAKQIIFNGDRSSSNTGLWFHGNGTQTLTQDIELTGDNDVQFEITDNNTNLVVSGDVSGNKLWKTGVGKMTLNGTVNVSRAKMSGGTLEFNEESTIGTYMITGGTTNFNADAAITTLGTESGSINATVTIGEDATVNITNINNNWGIGTMTVNGVLNVEDTFLFSSGNDRNTVNGTGIINTNKVTSQNVTNPAAFSGVTLNIGSGGIGGGRPVEFGTMTIGVRAGADGWTASNNNISLAEGATTTFAPGENQSITMGNIGGAGSLLMNGEGTLNLNGTASYTGTTTVEKGTLNLGGNSHSMSILNVNGGKVTTSHSGGSGCVSGTININAGGTFEVNGEHDAFGYDDNGATAKIAMAGTEGNVARLVLDPSNHGSVTMKTNLELNGNAAIESRNGASLNTYGCDITVTNTGNAIDGLRVRSNVTVSTADGAELTLASLAQGTTTDANGTLTKAGNGTLILDAASITNTSTVVAAGVLELTDTVDSITGALTIDSGATFKLAEYGDSAVAASNLTLASGSILDVSQLDLDLTSSTPYTLMKGGSISAASGVVVNFGTDDQVRYALTVDGSNNLVLTFVQGSKDLIWDGGNGNWSDTHWHTAAAPETSTNFSVKDNVTFDGTGGAATVTLTEGTEAGRMTLANGGSTLTVNTNGHDLIVDELVSADAANKLTKSGTGTATFNGESAVAFAALNTAADGGTTIFNTAVNLVGAGNQYWSRFKSDVQFNQGVAMSGTSSNSYAFLVDNSATVTMGGKSDLSGYNIGVTTGTGKVVIADGAEVTANKFLNSSSSLGSNGILVVEDGGTINLNQLYATQLDLRGTVNVTGNIGDSKIQTLNAQGGTAKFSANTVTVTTLNASGGVETVIDNARDLTVSAINFADNGTELTFKGHVVVNGGSRVEVGYNNNDRNNETATFEGGFDYTGTNDYALLIGKTNEVVMGGNSNWGGKTMGMEDTATLTLQENATVSVGRVFNSGTAANNGTVVLGQGAKFSITNTSGDASTISQVQNNGGTLEFANSTTLAGKVSGNGDISFNGSANKTLTMNGDVSEFAGMLQNTSNADLTVSLGTSANQLHMNISATGEGKVDLSMGGGDYFLYGTQNVRNITQPVSVHLEVRDLGNVTATGTVQTGNFDVGTTSDETGARFALSGQDAKLIYSGDAHSYSANVRGYGTFAVVDGATQELRNISNFHGIFEAEGEGSVLTLSGTLGNGTRLHASNDGVIILKQTYTLDDNVTVDDGTLRVDNGLAVNGAVDLSKGMLEQHGGTVTVNVDKSLTLGEASLTSAISNSGTVAFTKDITASGLAQESSGEVFVGADDVKTETANHFDGKRTESAVRVVSGNGTVTPDGHKVTQGDVAYTIQADGTAVGVTESNVDYAMFLQHEVGSTLNSSTITATAEQHDELIVNVDVNNANLNVDSALMVVQARAANITNTGDADNIEVLHIAGGTNYLTGGVSDLAQMTLFAQAEDSSLHIHSADGSAYQAKAGAVEFHGAQSEREVTISAARTDGDGADIYSLENERYSVEAHKMVKVADGNVTVNNHIKTDTVSTGETTGSLTLANGADAEALSEVIAASGDVTFLNMAAENKTTGGSQTAVSLNNLEIGAGRTASFYEAAAPPSIGELAQEASVTVVATLTAGAGATLNADLHMESGSVMDVSAAQSSFGLQLGSSLTLEPGAKLSDEDMLAVSSLSMENRWYYIATSAEQLIITGIGEWDGTKGERLTCEDCMHPDLDASLVYTDLEKGKYAMVYNWGQNVGTYTVALYLIPEPATTSLSLLALAALAARRRRK